MVPIDVMCELALGGGLVGHLCEFGVPEQRAGVGVICAVGIVQCEPRSGFIVGGLSNCIGTLRNGACALAGASDISTFAGHFVIVPRAYRLTKGEASAWTASEATIRAKERMMSDLRDR